MGDRQKRIRRILLGLFVGLLGLIGYGMYIEPKLLMIKRINIESPFITQAMDGFKIVQFTDTQLGDFYTLKDLKKAVDKINKMDADVVVFTGDLIDHMKTYEEDTNYIVALLKSIQAKRGKYAIYGNHDQGGGAHRIYPKIMKEANFTLLDNAVEKIEFVDGTISLIGIDDWLLGYPELDQTLKKVDPKAFNIMLIHEPDVADVTAYYPVDLQLSGHTHGGQVRIPFIGPLITPPVGHDYTHGLYEVGDRLKLYVNTGLGNTKLPLRLMNIPEITLFTLKHKD